MHVIPKGLLALKYNVQSVLKGKYRSLQIHTCVENLPVGLFSSVRLLLLPDNDRWSCDTEMQLDEEPSPLWSGVQKQREGESEHEIRESHILWGFSTIDDQAPCCFYLLSHVYSLYNLSHQRAQYIQTDQATGEHCQSCSYSHKIRVQSFTALLADISTVCPLNMYRTESHDCTYCCFSVTSSRSPGAGGQTEEISVH